MPTLLVVAQSRSGSTARLVDALVSGATDEAIEGVTVDVRSPFDTDAAALETADAVVLATPENFGYMSGALKDLFDRVYHDLLDRTRGLPYALVVKAGHDGAGAVTAVERIVTGLAWSAARPALVVAGEITERHLDEAEALGMELAASLDAGIL
jgi:multimeric flavodoxin WrbA